MNDAEKQVINAIVAAWHAYLTLPDSTSIDNEEFTRSINHCQAVIACRVARRLDPDLWAQPKKMKTTFIFDKAGYIIGSREEKDPGGGSNL